MQKHMGSQCRDKNGETDQVIGRERLSSPSRFGKTEEVRQNRGRREKIAVDEHVMIPSIMIVFHLPSEN